MTKQNDELNKILIGYQSRCPNLDSSLSEATYQARLLNATQEAKQQILDWHKREMKRVIGADTYENDIASAVETGSDAGAGHAIGKQQLRDEQRKRMEEE